MTDSAPDGAGGASSAEPLFRFFWGELSCTVLSDGVVAGGP